MVADIKDVPSYSQLVNGMTLENSQAKFVYTVFADAQPYIEINSNKLGISKDADSFSVEMWVNVDSAAKDTAVLFSFGGPVSSGGVSLPLYLCKDQGKFASGLQGQGPTYIAATVTALSLQLYINGTQLAKIARYSAPILFNGQGNSESANYIGWDRNSSTPGFIGLTRSVSQSAHL
jgi:hypothetical protein